jgi:hypothetical protein
MRDALDRRDFLKRTALASAATVAAGAAGTCGSGALAAESAAGPMPTIRLGTLEVSRMVLGSNPFFGFAHGNPQASASEMREWYTDQRVMAVLDEAAEQGVTAVWTPCYERWIRLWNAYREKGGKLKIWIGQPDRQPMEKEIMAAIDNGAKAVCIQGCQIDAQVGQGKWDTVRGWLELIKSHGLPAGMATHRADTHLIAEDKGMPTDFYHQTLYRPDNYVPAGLEESLATIERLDKPVVGYKVLGAGRIAPKDTLPQVFKRLNRKDGICLGVFPKKDRDQIHEDAALTKRLTV